MALIPVFKESKIEDLEMLWGLEFNIPEWSLISFDLEEISGFNLELDTYDVDYDLERIYCETNKYECSFYDKEENKNLSIVIYMNEDLNEIISIDEVILDLDVDDCAYSLFDTPLYNMLNI